MTTYEDKCKCDKHPISDQTYFKMEVEEFGSFDKILETRIRATCLNCGDVFSTIDKTPGIDEHFNSN